MDRTAINPLCTLRLLLVGGLFAVIWIIFGSGAAHAAESSEPPPAEPVNGSISSLIPPLKPVIAAVRTPVHPAPQETSIRPAQVSEKPAVAPSAPAGDLLLDGTMAKATAPSATLALDAALSPASDPLLDKTLVLIPVTAPVTHVAEAAVAPVLAPVTLLAAGTVQPLLSPVAEVAGGVLNPVSSVSSSLVGTLTHTVAAPASPVLTVPGVTPSSAPGGVQAGTGASASLATEASAPSQLRRTTANLTASEFAFPVGAGAWMTTASTSGDESSPRGPFGTPNHRDPATVPAPVSGSQGSGGSAGPGQASAADLSYRFMLPVTRNGEGFPFSFVVPKAADPAPGFSPG